MRSCGIPLWRLRRRRCSGCRTLATVAGASVFKAGVVGADADAARPKINLLKSVGLSAPPSTCVRANLSVLPLATQWFVLVGTLDSATAADCAADATCLVRQSPKPPSIAVAAALRTAAADKLASYPTTALQDVGLLESTGALRLAISYRLAQKRLLTTLIRECDSLLAGEGLRGRVGAFNAWIAAQNFPVNRLRASLSESHGGRLSAESTASLAFDEAYLAVPPTKCLSAFLARRDAVLGPALNSTDDFHALLYFLLREATSQTSQFHPYTALLPGVDDLVKRLLQSEEVACDLTPNSLPPLLWTHNTKDAGCMRKMANKWLRGSALESSVVAYEDAVRARWRKSNSKLGESPALQGALGLHSGEEVSYYAYAWATQILDSRSIWWSGERHLVPLLDLVNAAGGDDAQVGAPVHSTTLDATGNALTNAALGPYQKGDQVLEDYGQPNHVLFIYHGFSLAKNHHDCVRVELAVDAGHNSVPTADLTDPSQRRLRTALQQSGFRSGVLRACLKPGDSQDALKLERVYTFLAIQLGLPIPQQPGLDLVLALADVLAARLAAYETIGHGPQAAILFLQSEKALLRLLHDELTEQCSTHAFVQIKR